MSELTEEQVEIPDENNKKEAEEEKKKEEPDKHKTSDNSKYTHTQP